ncbi:MAG: pyridoxamine 5'-phosphate oxidase family protein [Candidatus Omnitrophota bacterium]
MLTGKISELLKKREFIYVASCDFSGRPNIAPKFLLKTENNFIYLIDHVFGRTWENLKINPVVSLSAMDVDSLLGYQINGSVELIGEGPEYDTMLEEFKRKGISLTAKRIAEGVLRSEGHRTFEVEFPERLTIFKVKIIEVVEIGSSGKLTREKA